MKGGSGHLNYSINQSSPSTNRVATFGKWTDKDSLGQRKNMELCLFMIISLKVFDLFYNSDKQLFFISNVKKNFTLWFLLVLLVSHIHSLE